MEALSSSVFIPPFQETRSSSTSSTSLRLNFCFPKTTLPGFRSRGIAAVTREVAGDGEDDEQPLVDNAFALAPEQPPSFSLVSSFSFYWIS